MNNNGFLESIKKKFTFQSNFNKFQSNAISAFYLINKDQFYYQLIITIINASFMDSLFYNNILRSLIMFAFSLAYEELFQTLIGSICYIISTYTVYTIWNYEKLNAKFLVAIHSVLLVFYINYGFFLIIYLQRSPIDFSAIVLTRDIYCEFILFIIRCLSLLISTILLITLVRSFCENSIMKLKFKDEVNLLK